MAMNAVYRGPNDLPAVIPVFPLPGALLLPRGQMPLNIFEPRYLAMVDDAMADRHRLIGMIQPDGDEPPDRPLSDFLAANNLQTDWEGIEKAPNEALVNALAMMSPYDPAEKQAMLEAPDLKTRAEILVAVTEIELAKDRTPGETPLQ
jgi:Lon protease-like protein